MPNHAIAATGTALGTNRRALRTLKNMFTDSGLSWVDKTNAPVVPANMWTTRYSCDSVTAGSAGDGIDRWDSDSDLVWANAGVAHSWWVGRQTAIATNAELLITCENASATGSALTIYVSPSAGFAGGSTTARPTAADEQVLLASTAWGGSAAVDANLKLHILKSSDGTCWRFFCCNGGQVNTFIPIEKAVPYDATAWTNPIVACAFGGNAATNVITNSNLNTNANIKAIGSSAMSLHLAGMAAAGSQSNVAQTTANGLTGKWPFGPQQLECRTAGANVGVHGYLQDLWYGSTTVATGSTAPTTGTQHQFAQFGSLIFPWCQVAAQVS